MYIYVTYMYIACRDNAVHMAIRYRMDGPGIDSRCKRDFPHSSRPAPGSTLRLLQRVMGLFPRGKAVEA